MTSSVSPICIPSSSAAAPAPASDLDGHIQVIFGPMFSGKTTELMRRMRRYTHAKKRCQVIKYSKDIRYDAECASTHDRQKCAAVGCTRLSELDPSSLVGVDVLGIDEGQFFPDCVEFADRWASQGKVVIVAALDATFERKPFGPILQLIPLAENVIKLNAVCMLCHREASFTKRIGSETAVEVIGGADKYLSTCRACFGLEAHSPTSAKEERAGLMAKQMEEEMPAVELALPAAAATVAAAPLSPSSASSSPVASLLPSIEDDQELAPLVDAEPTVESSRPSRALSSNKRIASQQQQPSTAASHKRKSLAADADADAANKKQMVASTVEANKENAPMAC